MRLTADEPQIRRQERIAWLLVGAGYALVILASLGSLVFEQLSDPGPGVGVVIASTLTLGALGLFILSASGSLIALWTLRSGNTPRRPAVLALLALGVVGVAVPGTLLATILIRGQ